MQELEGRSISHYRVQKQIDGAGLLKSYLATDRRTGQAVVMKLIPCSDQNDGERLHREIQVLSAVKQKHILSVLDYGTYDAWYYIVMPQIAYETVEQQFSKGPLSLEKAGNILKQLAYILQFAHRHGIMYCHIKPSNMLLKDGQHLYLTIESLLQNVYDDQSVAETDKRMETAECIAPVPVDGQTPLADETYALSIFLCQMLTGANTPSQALSPVGMLSQHTVDLQLPPSAFTLSLPRVIEDVILHALAKDPQQRFQTPLELVQAYQNALAQFRASTFRVNIPNTTKGQNIALAQRLPQKLRNKWLFAGAIAFAVMILLVSFLVAGVDGQITYQNRQVVGAGGKIHPSATVSSPTQNKSPNTNHPTGANTGNGQAYEASPTAQPGMQLYAPRPVAPPLKHPGNHGKGKNPGPPQPETP